MAPARREDRIDAVLPQMLRKQRPTRADISLLVDIINDLRQQIIEWDTPTPSEPECICGEINARHCPVHGVGTPSEGEKE